jgi:LysR family transcriptional regulator, transcriptional activator for dmlA
VNLQEDGYDIAIRTGTLTNSTLIAKRLAPDRHIIAASPAYLARRGRPTQPEDLLRHDCLILGDRVQWPFSKNGLETSVRIQGPIRSNDGELLCQAAQDGLGLIRASELVVLSELRSGKLTPVLADYEVDSNAAVWALYPSSKHLLPRMRALLDFLGVWFRDLSSGQNDTPVLATSGLGGAASLHPQAPAG